MKIKQFYRNFTRLFFLMALIVGQIGVVVSADGEAAAAEAFPGHGSQRYTAILNGKPIIGIGEETDRIFFLNFCCGDGPIGVYIGDNNINLGKSEINLAVGDQPVDFNDFVAKFVRESAEVMCSLKRSVARGYNGESFLSHRSHRTCVEGSTVAIQEPTIVDAIYSVVFKADTLAFGQPAVIMCPQNPDLSTEQDGGRKIIELPTLEKNTVFSSLLPDDLCVRDGVILMPNSDGGKGHVVEGDNCSDKP